MATKKTIRYQDAGVNIDEANRAVSRIKKLAKATFNAAVCTEIGSFGAGYRLAGMKKPILITSADGVGTKLKVAILAKRHDTIGEDLVNHCVNDIAVQGAVPLYFLDYFATGKLDAEVTVEVVKGLARGCKRNGCALIGGETAEMPGLYRDGEYDIAGFITGVVEEPQLITGKAIAPGDLLLGFPSNGLHTNGYSLARRLLFDVAKYDVERYVEELGCTVGEELLKVHRSYLEPLRVLHRKRYLKGAAHITGGGITENLPRILPAHCGATIDTKAWQVPAVFELLRSIGNVPLDDYRRTFNLGMGMIVAVSRRHRDAALALLKEVKQKTIVLGEVTKATGAEARVVRYQ
ncbi:MAG: phosphoribosylformylglycinamidine cyclo-ligase [Bryobacterales bacterium]|nr:phosphoribosylformylglycinamidine cyclo-ligase [Bryobacterales bacterium]